MKKTNKKIPSPRLTLMALWRSLSAGLSDPYRPELHYMRGPGPKWREKHQTVADRSSSMAPAAARVQGTYRLA
jgi:hypothetical protein